MDKIITTVKDEITFREAEGSMSKAELITAIEGHNSSLSTSMVVWDFTNAYAKDISSSDLKEIADIAIKKNSHRAPSDKTAVIFSSELEMDLGLQVGKYLEANELHYKFKVFTDMHDALIWLYTYDEIS